MNNRIIVSSIASSVLMLSTVSAADDDISGGGEVVTFLVVDGLSIEIRYDTSVYSEFVARAIKEFDTEKVLNKEDLDLRVVDCFSENMAPDNALQVRHDLLNPTEIMIQFEPGFCKDVDNYNYTLSVSANFEESDYNYKIFRVFHGSLDATIVNAQK